MANEKRNASIDITKFILALIVVMLHSATECLGTEHMAVRVIEYSGRFVVQFFLMVSGYYFTKMLVEKGTGFLRFFVRMMKIYLLWSVIYISLSFAVNVLLNGENAGEAVLGYVKNFFFVGSYWHLWYMVGLIYALCLTALFYKIAKERGLQILLGISIVFFVFGALCYAYTPLMERITWLRPYLDASWFSSFSEIMCLGIPCFIWGYAVVLFQQKNAMNPKRDGRLLILSLILYTVEFWSIVGLTGNTHIRSLLSTHFVTFFLMLVLLEHPASTWEKQGLLCKDYSTYLYLAHPLFIAILSAGQDMIGIQQPAALYVLEVLAFTLFSRVVLQWCRQFRVRRRGTNEK